MTDTERVTLESALLETLDELRGRFGAGALRRVEEFVEMAIGLRPRPPLDPLQRPELYFFPGLEDRPWHDESARQIPRLEAAAPEIRRELDGLVAGEAPFVPYVHGANSAYRAEKFRLDPLSERWTVYDLHEPAAEERCPRTTGLLKELFRYDLGEPVTAQFSALRPGSRIAPHCGTANFFLTAHLGLVTPPGCRIRVGSESRAWTEGRAFVFDDSFEHEVWHDGDATRVVLLLRYWHPELTAVEIEGIGTLHGRVIDLAGTTELEQAKALARLRRAE